MNARSLSRVAFGVALVLVSGGLSSGATARVAADIDRPPTHVISGGSTGFASPRGAARGADGNIYVANFAANSVTVHAGGATGNAPPLRTIAGAATGLNQPRGVAVDRFGYTYVSNYGANSITVYAPGATGDVAPVKTLVGAATGIAGPSQPAVDDLGRVYVADEPGSVRVFAPAATGNTAPIQVISGAATGLSLPLGLAVDDDRRIYVANWGSSVVTVYDPDSSGNVAPIRSIGGIVAGLGQPAALDLDDLGNLYVSNDAGRSVTVYPPGASGNVPPLVRLAGPASQITNLRGISVGADRQVTVAGYLAGTVLTFAPLVEDPPAAPQPTSKPGKVRALKVAGKATKPKRKISWKAPSNNGGTPITGYRVVVKKGKTTLVKRDVGAKKRFIQVKRAKLRKGKHQVIVRAKNVNGMGPKTTKAFRVRR